MCFFPKQGPLFLVPLLMRSGKNIMHLYAIFVNKCIYQLDTYIQIFKMLIPIRQTKYNLNVFWLFEEKKRVKLKSKKHFCFKENFRLL